MKYNIYMRLRGEITLVNSNLSELDAIDQVRTLNFLSNEGEVYYTLPVENIILNVTI